MIKTNCNMKNNSFTICFVFKNRCVFRTVFNSSLKPCSLLGGGWEEEKGKGNRDLGCSSFCPRRSGLPLWVRAPHRKRKSKRKKLAARNSN